MDLGSQKPKHGGEAFGGIKRHYEAESTLLKLSRRHALTVFELIRGA
jgi:hypothetical protein